MVFPIPSRADNAKIEDALRKLHSLRVSQFLADRPKPDLEALGLAPPELELALGQATTTTAGIVPEAVRDRSR